MISNLIIPLASDKTEYEQYVPEWLDMHPEGNLMLYECIRGLPLSEFEHIYFVILAKHDRKFNASITIESQFRKAGQHGKVDVICLDEPTRNQPETVAHAIEAAKISGSVFIKDGDNYFECSPLPENQVAIFPLDALKRVNPANKSYIMLDENQYVTNIIEKIIISRFFCAGGYGFEDSDLFAAYFKRLSHYERLYISHIIYAMLLDGHVFRPMNVKNYIDWGTREEWANFKNEFVTLFVPLTSLFEPWSFYSFTDQIVKAAHVEELKRLYDSGRTKIVLLSQRDESSRKVTEQMLKSSGVRYHQILFGTYPNNRIFQSAFELYRT